MSLRLIEIFLPDDKSQQVPALLQNYALIESWTTELGNGQSLIRLLLFSKEAEAVIDCLETHFAQVEGFRILLLSVEASVPRPQTSTESAVDSKDLSLDQELDTQLSRINRQELYEAIAKTVVLNWTPILMVLLSTIIAAIGLLRNDSTIIIGAMVIAPLLGPNMALSLATTLGDIELAIQAIRVGSIGIVIAFSVAVVIGYIFPVDPEIAEIASRTRVSGSDVVLALASGTAGALSFTSGVTSAVVGVMVAVALLPPLVTFGMLLGSGNWSFALGAMLLLLINLSCLNLAGVMTFSIQKVRPGKWWEAYQARKITWTALWVWLILLAALVMGIVLWRRPHAI